MHQDVATARKAVEREILVLQVSRVVVAIPDRDSFPQVDQARLLEPALVRIRRIDRRARQRPGRHAVTITEAEATLLVPHQRVRAPCATQLIAVEPEIVPVVVVRRRHECQPAHAMDAFLRPDLGVDELVGAHSGGSFSDGPSCVDDQRPVADVADR